MLRRIMLKGRSVLRPLGRIRFVIEERRYAGCEILRGAAGNDLIADTLRSGAPTAIAKIGASELGGIRHYLKCRDAAGHCPHWGRHRTMLFRNAGVYPPDPAIHSRFCRQYLDDLRQVDVLAVWFRWGERQITRQYAATARYVELTSLEPQYHPHPWSRHLHGRRVLVITPFTESVKSQYARHRQVWAAKPDVLPDFTLETIRSPLSAALVTPEHSDWFAALDHMKTQMERCPFDAAIIGAGAWSLPLAVHAKRLGKWAIHLGGGTQLLFGIKGRRWDEHPLFKQFFNDAWVRPSGNEVPPTATMVEGGCYW
jgi:hypothetical protein